jgi:hypothetical protein
MNITERDRLASALIALRPDWGNGAVDKVKRVRTWLSENAMEWSYRDAVVRMTVCAIEPSTVTPARALTDGPWSTIARTLTAGSTNQPLTTAERGGDCGYPGCDISQAMHRGARFPSDVRPHEWEQPRPAKPSDPAFIARVRPEFHRQEGQPA